MFSATILFEIIEIIEIFLSHKSTFLCGTTMNTSKDLFIIHSPDESVKDETICKLNYVTMNIKMKKLNINIIKY